MDKIVQKLRQAGYEVTNGQNGKPMVKITEKVIKCKENKGKEVPVGLVELGVAECSPKCPAGDANGYYLCMSGNCVYFPI